MNISDFQKMKNENRKISMITCYDYWSATIINETDVDSVLVGDSLAMVMHGHSSTIPANCEIMELHTKAVSAGIKNKFIIADMPFLSFRKGIKEAMNVVERLMKAGANGVKLEGVKGHEDVIKHIVESGVPVMGHLGLTPQSIQKFGGFKVQGLKRQDAEIIINDATALERLGCFSVVLECVPSELAKTITSNLEIPTIGIGAGQSVSGQVLVLQDMLGMNPSFNPKFVHKFLNGFELLQSSINKFNNDVKTNIFPSNEESY